MEEGGGNAFEINLLLQNLLHSEGFDSYPMLLSTRDNGLATKIYPVISDFNYVIVKLDINDKTYYLDATNPYLAFGEIPFYCLNQYGRVYDIEYASYWEDIIPNEYSTTQIGAKFKLDSDNRMKGTVSFNKDFTEMYFTRCFNDDKKADNYCSIMMSKFEDASWSIPVKIKLFEEVEQYWDKGNIVLNGKSGWMAKNLEVGKKAIYKDRKSGRTIKVKLDSPKRGGNRKFIVYRNTGRTDKETGEIVAKKIAC